MGNARSAKPAGHLSSFQRTLAHRRRTGRRAMRSAMARKRPSSRASAMRPPPPPPLHSTTAARTARAWMPARTSTVKHRVAPGARRQRHHGGGSGERRAGILTAPWISTWTCAFPEIRRAGTVSSEGAKPICNNCANSGLGLSYVSQSCQLSLSLSCQLSVQMMHDAYFTFYEGETK